MLMRLLPALLAVAVPNATAAAAEKAFAVAIAQGKVATEQRVMRAEKGDAVRLRITSDTAGALHLHGYRLEKDVKPGEAADIAFTAYATGRYPLEWHPAGDTRASRPHHGPPLAVLEVRPK